MDATALCRDCLAPFAGPGRCPSCRSPRTLHHPELTTLAIAHLDCDAFYAAVEKRDDPSLRDRPVIVGGGARGVVSTACYIARISGVRSAMPMFRAQKLCPEAVVIRPRMAHYAAVSAQIRALMQALTPQVEPLSLDEAFLDLTGTVRLHRAPPAITLARLQARIETELGLGVSIGLSHNKFLAKIASDLDKPRGFRLIGRAETLDFLALQPVSVIWGVGGVTAAALEAEGLRTIADLRGREQGALIARFGALGFRLWHLARGEDARGIAPGDGRKSISHETTFAADLRGAQALEGHLWRLCEAVSDRAKALGLGGRAVTLKLKRADHRLLTRRRSLATPAQMADSLYHSALPMLHGGLAHGPFRLLGVGIGALGPADEDAMAADLLDPAAARRQQAERARDTLRARFGGDAVILGRALS